ncbi:hypothetical protein LOD99_5938 [Oopsacas minuta]|uniref:Tetraspanin n=1 Tax=Oopsacas minuta TaxID=111878 RepID=A0AAV7JP87_9METZ|nr:hypothetical protein LOD99_5938 [Oopsacas minuta]
MGFLAALRILLAVINIIANILGFLFSVIIIAIGVVGLVRLNLFFSGNLSENILFFNVGFSLCVAVGVIAVIFTVAAIVGSYLAYCPANGVMKGIAVCFLSAHLIAFVVVFLLALAGVVVAFVFSNNVANNLIPVLNSAVNESYMEEFDLTQTAVIAIQSLVGCCGVTGPGDFAEYPGYNTSYLPQGCCNSTVILCTEAEATEAQGCGRFIREQLEEYYNWIGGVGIFELIVILLFMLVELVLIILVIMADKDGGMKVV